MMVGEVIFTNEGGLPISRCIQCGEVVDQVVILNRYRTDFTVERATAKRHVPYQLSA